MQIGMIGLGRMGSNMVLRLLEGGHECRCFSRHPETEVEVAEAGAFVTGSLEEMVSGLQAPRPVWIMVPDPVVDRVINQVTPLLEPGDIVIDGGNTYFPNDVRRARELAEKGIGYLDVGTSGGIWGRKRGYCLMIGGPAQAVDRLEPVFETLSPDHDSVPSTPGREAPDSSADRGWLHCGGPGAGHFVKMVHNGIEYGMMAAFAEGFAMLYRAGETGAETGVDEERVKLDVETGDIAELWRRGSVVGSWLLDLAAASLHGDPSLRDFSGHVSDSGEGRWTVKTATDMGIPAQVITTALFARFASRGEADYANKVLSALRHAFGGHVESG